MDSLSEAAALLSIGSAISIHFIKRRRERDTRREGDSMVGKNGCCDSVLLLYNSSTAEHGGFWCPVKYTYYVFQSVRISSVMLISH